MNSTDQQQPTAKTPSSPTDTDQKTEPQTQPEPEPQTQTQPEPQTQPKPQQNAQQPSNNTNTTTASPTFKVQLYRIESWLKLIFVVFSLIHLPLKNYSAIILSLGIITCVLGLRRQLKGFRFSKEALATAMTKDFGVGALYLISMFLVNNPLRLFCLPMTLYFVLGFANFVKLEKVYFFQKIEKVDRVLTVISQNSNSLKVAKLYIEFFLFFYSIVLVCMGKVGFVIPLALYNMLKLRMLNSGYKQALMGLLGGVSAKLQGGNAIMRTLGKLWGYFCKLWY